MRRPTRLLLKTRAGSLALWLGLGVSFFGSLRLAASFYPQPYDWSRIVMSSLDSPRDNPHGYGIACVGLVMTGLLLIPSGALVRRRLKPYSPRCTTWAAAIFLVAAISLALSALFVPGHYRILGLGRSHEHLAQIFGVTLYLSLILYLKPICALPPSRGWVRVAALLLIAGPAITFLASRLSLLVNYALFSPAVYQAAKIDPWNNLALWEWIGAVCTYLFLGLIIFGLPEPDRASGLADAKIEVRVDGRSL